jgi:hypothetical protein
MVMVAATLAMAEAVVVTHGTALVTIFTAAVEQVAIQVKAVTLVLGTELATTLLQVATAKAAAAAVQVAGVPAAV